MLYNKNTGPRSEIYILYIAYITCLNVACLNAQECQVHFHLHLRSWFPITSVHLDNNTYPRLCRCAFSHICIRVRIFYVPQTGIFVADCKFSVVLIRDIKRGYIELSVMPDYPNRPQRLALVRDDVTPCMKFVSRTDGRMNNQADLFSRKARSATTDYGISSWQIYIPVLRIRLVERRHRAIDTLIS